MTFSAKPGGWYGSQQNGRAGAPNLFIIGSACRYLLMRLKAVRPRFDKLLLCNDVSVFIEIVSHWEQLKAKPGQQWTKDGRTCTIIL